MQFYDLHRRMEDIDIEKTFGVDTREKGVELTPHIHPLLSTLLNTFVHVVVSLNCHCEHS